MTEFETLVDDARDEVRRAHKFKCANALALLCVGFVSLGLAWFIAPIVAGFVFALDDEVMSWLSKGWFGLAVLLGPVAYIKVARQIRLGKARALYRDATSKASKRRDAVSEAHLMAARDFYDQLANRDASATTPLKQT